MLLRTTAMAAVGVLPVTTVASLAIALDPFDGPAPPFWTIWPTLAYPLVALSIVLALLGAMGWLTRRGRAS